MNPHQRATPRRPVLASFLAAMLLVGACGGATGDGSDDDFAGGGAWFQASLSDFVPQALSGTGSVRREGAFLR